MRRNIQKLILMALVFNAILISAFFNVFASEPNQGTDFGFTKGELAYTLYADSSTTVSTGLYLVDMSNVTGMGYADFYQTYDNSYDSLHHISIAVSEYEPYNLLVPLWLDGSNTDYPYVWIANTQSFGGTIELYFAVPVSGGVGGGLNITQEQLDVLLQQEYNKGYQKGQEDFGSDIGNDFAQGYDLGYNQGFLDGKVVGEDLASVPSGVFSAFFGGLSQTIAVFSSLEIGGIPLGLILGLSIMVAITILILKFVRG